MKENVQRVCVIRIRMLNTTNRAKDDILFHFQWQLVWYYHTHCIETSERDADEDTLFRSVNNMVFRQVLL